MTGYEHLRLNLPQSQSTNATAGPNHRPSNMDLASPPTTQLPAAPSTPHRNPPTHQVTSEVNRQQPTSGNASSSGNGATNAPTGVTNSRSSDTQPPAAEALTELNALRAQVAELHQHLHTHPNTTTPARTCSPLAHRPLVADQETIERAKAAALSASAVVKDDKKKAALPAVVRGFKANALDIGEDPFFSTCSHSFTCSWARPSRHATSAFGGGAPLFTASRNSVQFNLI
jgi:hypothetical protein